jgi:hypothetical protein
MVKAHDVWPCGAFLAGGHLNQRSFTAMLRQIFAGAGTGELVQRNDKAWSCSTTTVSPPGAG